MNKKTETFQTLLKAFEYRYDLRTVFDDFLTMTICSLSYNPNLGKSPDEHIYLETIAKYKDDKLRHQFPELLAQLIIEMEERVSSGNGNDILGEVFELEFSKGSKGQFFTPWPICKFMASCTGAENEELLKERPVRILDPTCGSGRMLLAGAEVNGKRNHFYGIDIDHTCVKMAAINLFFNGIFHSEVMWADALRPDDFRMSYKLSFLPLGIFRISEREQSPLWEINKNSFWRPKVDSEPNLVSKITKDMGSQLNLF